MIPAWVAALLGTTVPMDPRLSTALAIASFLACCGPAAAETAAPVAADAQVITVAGSGLPGLRDGPSATAEFLEPAGVAAGLRGDVYVADAAGQRIRRIDSSGRVTTVAGSGAVDPSGLFVPGAYADGPAAAARFDHPTGLAVAPDGALLVADRLNHCIRRIAGGVVTTFAGKASEPGSADGGPAVARFQAPMGVAFDRAGNLFVADFGNGVRKIDPAGTVTTVTLPKGRGLLATSVATDSIDGHDILLVALQSGVVRIDLTSSSAFFYVAGLPAPGLATDSPDDVFMEGSPNLGTAYAAAPFGDGRFLYTDLRGQSVREIWGRQARVLAGASDEDASFDGGAFRDGGGSAARFDAPLGIARIGLDRFVVADAGNRRIRLLTVHQAPGESFADLTAAKGSYRIVYAGNSFVDYDGDDRTSIASLIEDSLRTRATALGLPRPPRLFTVKLIADVSGLGSFIRNYFAGTADLVIWQTNAAELTGFVGAASLGGSLAPSVDTWRPVFARELRSTRDALAAEHTPMLAVLNPMPWQISPIESAYQRLYDLPVPAYEIARADGDLLRRAFADAGVPGLDLFPAFETRERAPDRDALFASLDHHFSQVGRALVAREIVAKLASMRPWAASAHGR